MTAREDPARRSAAVEAGSAAARSWGELEVDLPPAPLHRLPAEATGCIRVLLADGQALVRAGFRMLLEAQPDIQVVGEAADGEQAVQAARRLRPDVALMDARLPILDGIQAARRLAASGAGVRVLILTTVDLDEDVDAAIRAGASGFLLKDVRPAQLVEAIRVVAAGGVLLAPSVTRRLLERLARTLPASSQQPPPRLGSLTARELEVLRLLATGLSNAELAKRLGLAEATVKTHLSSLLRKLDRRDRVQAVILAYDAGLVRPAWAGQPARPTEEGPPTPNRKGKARDHTGFGDHYIGRHDRAVGEPAPAGVGAPSGHRGDLPTAPAPA